ncbi:mitochondrial carrier domain-containing protein [Syncephalis fuscata]|nr:mitochondrial carrier domain-containing protein [Syncephalis fuscata]
MEVPAALPNDHGITLSNETAATALPSSESVLDTEVPPVVDEATPKRTDMASVVFAVQKIQQKTKRVAEASTNNSDDSSASMDPLDSINNPLLIEGQTIQQLEDQLQKRHSVSAGATSAVVRSMILKPLYLWYKSPLKLFRPVRVDYLVMARAMVPPKEMVQISTEKYKMPATGALLARWQASTFGLLSNAIRQEGWSFIPRHVLPPLFANGACGAVLFTTYELVQLSDEYNLRVKECEQQLDQREGIDRIGSIDMYDASLSSTIPVTSYLKAGAAAGAMHAVVATPLDALQVRLEVKDFLSGRFNGFMDFARTTARELGTSGMYRGFLFTMAKDSLGYAVFFSVFDTAKAFFRRRKQASLTASTITILTAGAAAGAAYQLVDHPLDRIRSAILLKGGEQVHGGLYATSWHRCRRLAIMSGGWRTWLYTGLGTNLMKAVPATSIGLFCYEMLKRNFDE